MKDKLYIRSVVGLIVLFLLASIHTKSWAEGADANHKFKGINIITIFDKFWQKNKEMPIMSATEHLERYLEKYVLTQVREQGFGADYLGVYVNRPILPNRGMMVVKYSENQGSKYDLGVYGTIILVSMQLFSPSGKMIWEKNIRASTSFMAEIDVVGGYRTLDTNARENLSKSFGQLNVDIAEYLGEGVEDHQTQEIYGLIAKVKKRITTANETITTIQALGLTKNTLAIEPLTEILLTTTDFDIISSVIGAFRHIHDKKTIGPLIKKLLTVSDSKVKDSIIATLNDISDDNLAWDYTSCINWYRQNVSSTLPCEDSCKEFYSKGQLKEGMPLEECFTSLCK